VKRYVLDANIYIDADRSAAKAAELEAFYNTFLSQTYVHAIVAQELLRGVADQRRRIEVRAHYIAPFEKRGRLVTPTFTSWVRAGELVAMLIARKLVDATGVAPSFLHDVLLAASCREAGMTLVTRNVVDFERIRHVERFDFVPPWPVRSAVS